MVSEERTAEVEVLLTRAARWAEAQGDIEVLVLVGSWARGAPQPDSDVDLVLLTHNPTRYLDGKELVQGLGALRVIHHQNWGAVEERRLLLPSGLQVEVGVGLPSWAQTEPLDAGTRAVVRMGGRALYDPEDRIGPLIRACAEP